jgi:hypothetical protein
MRTGLVRTYIQAIRFFHKPWHIPDVSCHNKVIR